MTNVHKHLKQSVKPLLVIAACTATMFTLAACGSKSSDSSSTKKQEISVSIASEIETLDTGHFVDTSSSEILNNVEEGLIVLGKNSKVTPGIATNWKTSKDGLTYTYTLRHDAKWNDGSAVTAKDFVYGWQRMVNPKTAAENGYMYSGIKNADAIMAGKKDYKTLGIKADGKYKLTVTLEHPISYFNLLIGNGYFMPVQQTAVEKWGKKYGTTAAKTAYDGPYTVKKWSGSETTWTLVKNKKYYNYKNIDLDKVTYHVVKEASTGLNMYENGQLDQVQLTGEQVSNEQNNKDFAQALDASNVFALFNMKQASTPLVTKAFQNVNIRRALSISLDRAKFTKHVLADGSVAATGVVSAGMMKSTSGKDFADVTEVPAATDYNKAEAKRLWKKGLKQIGATSLSFTLLGDDDDTHKAITEYLQGQWTSVLGAKVTVKTVPKTTRVQALMDKSFDVVVSGWGSEYNDPSTFLNLFDTTNSYNFGSYDSKKFHSLMTTVNTTASATKRWKAMVAAEKTLMTDNAAIPLYQAANSYLRNPKIKGLIINAAGTAPGWRGVSLK